MTSASIGAFALRYDFTDWGSSRLFFDIGTILTPFEKVYYSRGYVTSLGNVALQSSANASEYGVYGRAGWISRFSPRDEVAASIEVWQLWQHVNGYSDPGIPFDPFNASIAAGTDRTNLAKIGAQWTHLFGSNIEGNLNGGFVQSFGRLGELHKHQCRRRLELPTDLPSSGSSTLQEANCESRWHSY